MLPIVLFILAALVTIPLAVYHFAGYYNGRY